MLDMATKEISKSSAKKIHAKNIYSTYCTYFLMMCAMDDDYGVDTEEIDAVKVEEERKFIGICSECDVDVNEVDSQVCPMCGAIYHEWCFKSVCPRCGMEIRQEPEETEDEL